MEGLDAQYRGPLAIEGNARIDVVSHEKRSDRENEWVVFQVTTTPVANTTGESHFGSPESPATTVWRRFSDFELLRQYFAYIIPSALLPPLPEKTMNFKIAKLGGDRFDPVFLEKRRAAFQCFMRRLLKHPRITSSKALYEFCVTQKWAAQLEVEVPTGGRELFDPAMVPKGNMFSKTPTPDRRFVNHKHFASQFKDTMQKLLADQNNQASSTIQWQLEYAAFEDAAGQYAELEKTAGSALATPLADMATGFAELVAGAPEHQKQQETSVADPMKEHMLYADSMKELLDRQDQTQSKYEAKQKSTASKQKQIEQLEKPEGFSGFFRSLSTPNKEAEAAKMVQLTAELEACKISELDQEQATINFNETALTEFADFGAIRTADMKGLLVQYAKLQKSFYEKQLASWIRIQQASSDPRVGATAE